MQRDYFGKFEFGSTIIMLFIIKRCYFVCIDWIRFELL